MPPRRSKPKKKQFISKLTTYPAVFTQENYLNLIRVGQIGHSRKPPNRSQLVRIALDLGMKSWKPEPLGFKAQMTDTPFKLTRVVILKDQKQALNEYEQIGYSGNLAFNTLVKIGLEMYETLALKVVERDRHRGKGTYPARVVVDAEPTQD